MSKIKKSLVSLLAFVMAFAGIAVVFANDANTEGENFFYIDVEFDLGDGEYIYIQPFSSTLIDDNAISSLPAFYTGTLRPTNSNNVNVWFSNTSGTQVTVEWQRWSGGFLGIGAGWSNSGSFPVSGNSNTHRELSADRNDHRVRISNTTGARITGHLRVRQL